MVVSYTRARKRKKKGNHLTVATFILSYKDDGQFVHGGEETKERSKKKFYLASILGIGVTVNAARESRTLGILARDSNGEPAITGTADLHKRSPVRLYFTFRFFVKLVHINCDHYVNILNTHM